MKKGMICILVCMLFIVAMLPSGTLVGSKQNQEITDTTHSLLMKSRTDGIILNGTMGKHGIYISPVTITFENGSWPYVFVEIDGGSWFEYTEPIVVSEEGLHHVTWRYTDLQGNQSAEEIAWFRIDMTPPMITLTKEKTGMNEITFSIFASDNVSDIWYLELYLDGSLIENISQPMYEYVWTGFGEHIIKAIAYDLPGFNTSSSISTSCSQCHLQSRLLHLSIMRVIQNILLCHQMLIRHTWY